MPRVHLKQAHKIAHFEVLFNWLHNFRKLTRAKADQMGGPAKKLPQRKFYRELEEKTSSKRLEKLEQTNIGRLEIIMQQQLLANCRRSEMESEWGGKGEQEQKAEKVVQKAIIQSRMELAKEHRNDQTAQSLGVWSNRLAGYDQMERISQRADYCDYFYYNCVRKCLGSHWGTRPRESVSRCCQLLMTTTPLTTLLPPLLPLRTL